MSGLVDRDVVLEIGGQRVRVGPAPGAPLDAPQGTESLARELVRGLLGGTAVPVLELVKGPGAPAKRELPAPGGPAIVIGRGDEASWVILDEDLSREHAELTRDWDGVLIRDLGSKNGTRVEGQLIASPARLTDGARIELGEIALVFHDPAERHLIGTSPPRRVRRTEPAAPVPAAAGSRMIGGIATGVAVVALVALIWVAAS